MGIGGQLILNRLLDMSFVFMVQNSNLLLKVWRLMASKRNIFIPYRGVHGCCLGTKCHSSNFIVSIFRITRSNGLVKFEILRKICAREVYIKACSSVLIAYLVSRRLTWDAVTG